LALDFLIVCGSVLLIANTVRRLREYSRRHIFGRKRASQIQAAFPEFCYQPFPTSNDIYDLVSFPHLAEDFELSISQHLIGGRPEMYNMIDDQRDNVHRSVFDLRLVSRAVGGGSAYSHTSSIFLFSLPEHQLTPFSISIESFGFTTLWGDDPDIDIEDEFVFSKSFYLTGPDRDAVTRIFDKTLVRFFRSHTLLFAAGSLDVSPNAIIFRHGNAIAPKDIRSTLDALSKLIELLAR